MRKGGLAPGRATGTVYQDNSPESKEHSPTSGQESLSLCQGLPEGHKVILGLSMSQRQKI